MNEDRPVKSPRLQRTNADVPSVTEPSAVDRIIESWFTERMHNSVVSRHTEIINYVRSEVDDLKRRLAQEI